MFLAFFSPPSQSHKTLAVTLKDVNEFIKELYTEKGKVLGTFEMDVDGYFYFWRNKKLKGCASSDLLRRIADKLDEVNKEWDEYLKNNL